jgi:hypothetical protein
MAVNISRPTLAGPIADAVICLPTELCKLTAAYLIEIPHKFTAFETVRTTDKTDVETEIAGSAEVQPYVLPWRTMVSSESFAVGHLAWTIDFSWKSGSAWIGVGVTRSSVNHKPDEIAGVDDWIICLYGTDSYNGDSGVSVCHNGLFTKPIKLDKSGTGRFRVDCRANPADGTITASVAGLADPITIVTAVNTATYPSAEVPFGWQQSDMPDFRFLRPCVVVAGLTKGTVRSGGTANVIT